MLFRSQVYESSSYIRSYDFVGLVLAYNSNDKMMLVEQRNNFAVGDELEIVSPKSICLNQYTVKEMYDDSLNPINVAPHAQQKLYLPLPFEVPHFSILRKKPKCCIN